MPVTAIDSATDSPRPAHVGVSLRRLSPVARSMTEPAITLYRLQACPFCERVVRVLDQYDLDYHSRFVEPRHSERDVVKRISGSRTVPAIVDERTGVTMSESGRIVEYLHATYGEGETPTDPTATAEGS
jgi:glutathione S-transferase